MKGGSELETGSFSGGRNRKGLEVRGDHSGNDCMCGGGQSLRTPPWQCVHL